MFIKKMSHVWPIFGLLFLVSPLHLVRAVEDQDTSAVYQELSNQEEQVIIATGSASYGTSEIIGKACVVTSRKQLRKVCKGDIVIAPAINSFWYSGLASVSAIITEKPDNNAIAFGKKMNIPVIVGATGATKKIVDGQVIICDPVTNNIYHVADPRPSRINFDMLTMPEKSDTHIITPESSSGPSTHLSRMTVETGTCVIKPGENKNRLIVQSTKKQKLKPVTKDIYRSLFPRFKKFVLGEMSQFKQARKYGMWLVEKGARYWDRCDDFAVECICVGEELFSKPDNYVVAILQRNGESDERIEDINEIMNECSTKPGDLNNVAYKAHKKLVESTVAADVKKEDLIEHPREYRKLVDAHKIDKEKQEEIMAEGLFVRFWMKEQLYKKY